MTFREGEELVLNIDYKTWIHIRSRFCFCCGGPLVLPSVWPALNRLCSLAGSSWNLRDLFKSVLCNHLWGLAWLKVNISVGNHCVYPSLSGAFKVHFAVYLCWCHLKHFSWSPDVMRSINVSSELGRYWTLILLVIFQDEHLIILIIYLIIHSHIWMCRIEYRHIWTQRSVSVLVNDLLLSFSPHTGTSTAAALFQTHSTGRKLKVWRVCLSEFSWYFRWLRILWPDLRARWQNFSTR